MPRERNHTIAIATAAAMMPLTDGHTPILMSDPEDEHRDRDRGRDHEAELELDRRDVVERVSEPFAACHGCVTGVPSGSVTPAAYPTPCTVRTTSLPSLRRSARTCESTVRAPAPSW